MNRLSVRSAWLGSALLPLACLSQVAQAQDATPAPAPAAPAPTSVTVQNVPSASHLLSEDRIAFSANGSSLTGTSGGGGAAGTWLHNFNPDTLLGLGVEYQALSVSHWTFGTLTGSMTRGPSDQRYTLYGEAHEGAGDDGPKPFKYRIEALGLTGTYFHRLSATIEDRQFNVETTHGNMPKVGLSYLWAAHVQTALNYQHSFGGNLDTSLTSGRIDIYEPIVNFFAGFAVGRTSPTVIGQVLGGTVLQARQFREGYVGLSRSLPSLRSDVTLIGDYQHLQGVDSFQSNGATFEIPGSNRWTGTLNWIYHIGH